MARSDDFRLPPAVRRALERRESLVIRLATDALGRTAYTAELEDLPLQGRADDVSGALAQLDACLAQGEKLAGLEQLKQDLAAFDPSKPSSVRRRIGR